MESKDLNSVNINIPEMVESERNGDDNTSFLPSTNASRLSSTPDLITDLRLRGTTNVVEIKDAYTSGLIKPFSKPGLTIFSSLAKEFKNVSTDQRSKKIYILCLGNIVCTTLMFSWCQSTGSMALTAYTYLTIFDFMVLITCLLSIWVEQQTNTATFTFGYQRFEVLAVFACTVLAQLGSFFIVKESIERLLIWPKVHTGGLLIAALAGFIWHLIVTYFTDSSAWYHVISASSSSWLQEHVADVSQNLCHFIPGLSRLLLPRANPMVLIAFAGGISLNVTHLLLEMNDFFIVDPLAAICIALMSCGTMFPMSVFSGKILLQTTPSHIVGQLDKCLREASTLDGVLEFRNEHFWTLSFGVLAGSLHVRIRRDANEQLVLAHIVDRLSNLVKELTVQVFKDDWTRSHTTFQLLSDTACLTGSSVGKASATSLERGSTGSRTNTSYSAYLQKSTLTTGNRNPQIKLNVMTR